LFPEFGELVRDEYSSWLERREYGTYFSCVLDPILCKELASMQNVVLLKRIFKYLETLEISKDKNRKEIVLSTLINLCSDNKSMARARPLMGENTSKMSSYVERFWGN
jgi:hypothetical protein